MASAGPLTIAVLIKQVPDMNAIRIDRATGRIVPSPQLVMSSYDEYAVEAALRLKESFGGEVIAVAAGPAPGARRHHTRAGDGRGSRHPPRNGGCQRHRHAWAWPRSCPMRCDPLRCSLVIAGQTSDDFEAGQVGAQVAELLKMPVISNVVEIRIDENGLLVRRDMEDGYQTVRSTLPAVLLSSTGLDQPRLPSLKGIMAAKKKPVENVAASVPDGASPRLGYAAGAGKDGFRHDRECARRPSHRGGQTAGGWLQEQKLI